jgi:hypothetical protein
MLARPVKLVNFLDLFSSVGFSLLYWCGVLTTLAADGKCKESKTTWLESCELDLNRASCTSGIRSPGIQ